MTTQDLIQQMTDPKSMLKAQRKATLAAYETWMTAHDEARKLTLDTLQRTLADHEATLRPIREAAEEISQAQFDLTRRALEVGKSETERWYKTVMPAK